MGNIYRKLVEFTERGENVALATVIRTRGSVPREVGARMIVHPQGQHVGTVGGGCGEAEVIRAALDVIATGEPRVVRADLAGEISMESQGVCGGTMDIFVETWPPPGCQELVKWLLQSVEERKSMALLTVVSAPGGEAGCLANKALIWLDGKPVSNLGLGQMEPTILEDARLALEEGECRLLEYEIAGQEVEVFVEVHRPPPTLLIVGAGHIALPLVQMGKLLDFEVVVLDDRASMANKERFPQADRVIAADFEATLRHFPIDEGTYVVLITRGHQHDVTCLLEIIDSPAAYIGMIGSRRRVAAVFQLLEEEQGLSRQKLGRVYAPIGLDIGAQTPAEIAVSIIAEVVKILRQGAAPSISDYRR